MFCFAPDISFTLEVTHFLGEDAEVPAVSVGPAVPTVQHRVSAAHPKNTDLLSILRGRQYPAEMTLPRQCDHVLFMDEK